MQRREFLESITGPVVAACAVCMGACSKSATSSGNSGNSGAVAANFTVNLGSSLLNVGDSLAISGVIIARLATGNSPSSFVAVQQSCTHEGTNINFVPSNKTFLCPNHGAIFNTSGANTGGQSTGALKVYNIAVSGTTLTVTG